MKEANNVSPQLKYPFRVDVLIRIIFLWLLLWGGAVFEVLPKTHYSFYEDPIVEAIACIGDFLAGTFFLQGLVAIITHWEKYTLLIDHQGLHGVDGVTFIAWSEIASIGDKTRRYTLLGQRSHFLTIRVRSVNKILQREHGYTTWVRRLGKSPDFPIVNVKRKEIQAALRDIERMFPHELQTYNIRLYGLTSLPADRET